MTGDTDTVGEEHIMLTLVTGTTGQVGRRFVPRLLAQRQPGEQVRVLVRDAARGERFAELGAQVAVGDMRDEETLGKALAGVDAVVNVAASFRGVPDEEAWAVNRDAAVALGRAAQALGVERFVQVSTDNVYGVGRGRPLTEEDESRPGGEMWGAYPESKAAAERELLYAPGIAGRIYNIADDAPVTTVELYRLNGVEVPAGLHELTDPDPWFGIMSSQRIRRELGFRPIYPSVWTARDAGAL